ncbi:MAG: PDDEXK nuclease domain-containing protein [Phycisphaerae bacterium]|jgi:predicted nuclease of restriction endonuclease-like (RecB) superfamily
MRTQKNKTSKAGSTVDLIHEIRQIILSARKFAAKSIDTVQVLTNYEIGHRIVEHEQHGTKRAAYGKAILKELSKKLTVEFGRGFSEDNLSNMRKFYLVYRNQKQISETASRKLTSPGENIAVSGKLQISETVSRKLTMHQNMQTVPVQFTLSWSHYIFLMNIHNVDERRFYEIESLEMGWSLRELKRQFSSGLYERLALSRDKKGIRKLSRKGQVIEKPQDLLKNPYVLEFLGLDEKSQYSETDLENAIIDKLEHFLLELGKGFLFESRQKRFTFDEEHFFVDLVFYNRILRCYVLFDLKIGKLTHQDIGQMQMYVNYFDRYVKQPHENATVGIILCRKKKDALVEITLPKNANIRASEYQLYLPSKVELKQKLIDWTKEQ